MKLSRSFATVVVLILCNWLSPLPLQSYKRKESFSVTLVTKSLREQSEHGDDFQALQKALDILPNELEELYDHLLNSISKVARKKACQIFAMAKKLSDNHQLL